jgi:hypothetical protein
MDRDAQSFINAALVLSLLVVVASLFSACAKPEMDAKSFYDRQDRARF